jgi:hypothetical protein
VDTSGSLVDTSRTLVDVRTLAGRISTTLVGAQSRNSLGTNAIWRRVRFINGGPFLRGGSDEDTNLTGADSNPNGLSAVLNDADSILTGLRNVNTHLTSICEAPVLQTPLPGYVRPGPC